MRGGGLKYNLILGNCILERGGGVRAIKIHIKQILDELDNGVGHAQ